MSTIILDIYSRCVHTGPVMQTDIDRASAMTRELEGMVDCLEVLTMPILEPCPHCGLRTMHAHQCPNQAPPKQSCVSCGDVIDPRDNEIGACEHGLLCNICRYDSQCLQCKRSSDIPHASDCATWVGESCDCITGRDPDDLPDEAFDPHDAEEILRYE